MDLASLKNRLAIDSDVFDNLLETAMRAAEMKIKGAVGTDEDFYNDNDLYELGVIMLTDHYFKNRSATTTKSMVETPLGVTDLILQLKAKYSVFEERKDDSNGNS